MVGWATGAFGWATGVGAVGWTTGAGAFGWAAGAGAVGWAADAAASKGMPDVAGAGDGAAGVEPLGEVTGTGADGAGGGSAAVCVRAHVACMHCKSSAQSDDAVQVEPSTPSFFVSQEIRVQTTATKRPGERMPVGTIARTTCATARRTSVAWQTTFRPRRRSGTDPRRGPGRKPPSPPILKVRTLGG